MQTPVLISELRRTGSVERTVSDIIEGRVVLPPAVLVRGFDLCLGGERMYINYGILGTATACAVGPGVIPPQS